MRPKACAACYVCSPCTPPCHYVRHNPPQTPYTKRKRCSIATCITLAFFMQPHARFGARVFLAGGVPLHAVCRLRDQLLPPLRADSRGLYLLPLPLRSSSTGAGDTLSACRCNRISILLDLQWGLGSDLPNVRREMGLILVL